MAQREAARILIVDDDPDNGEFLQKNLTTPRCKAVWYGDPVEALEQCRKGRYAAGILDLKMPGMNGVELFQKLRRKDPALGLIILTGYPSVDSALETLKTGAYDYVKKPYRLEGLRAIVQRILEEKGFFLDSEVLINQRIGRRIKEFRVRRDWTVTRLAMQTQLSKSLISQIENAKNSASLISLSKIARSLHVRLTDLVQDL
jgi:DNA-binding NtrC family response regulator